MVLPLLALTVAAQQPYEPVERSNTRLVQIDAVVRSKIGPVKDLSREEFTGGKTAAALEAIANRIRGIPGRKNLIWITSGFPFLTGCLGDGQTNSEDSAFDNGISG